MFLQGQRTGNLWLICFVSVLGVKMTSSFFCSYFFWLLWWMQMGASLVWNKAPWIMTVLVDKKLLLLKNYRGKLQHSYFTFRFITCPITVTAIWNVGAIVHPELYQLVFVLLNVVQLVIMWQVTRLWNSFSLWIFVKSFYVTFSLTVLAELGLKFALLFSAACNLC